MLDTENPDNDTESENVGAYRRTKLYCIEGNVEKPANVIPLQASVTTSISSQG